MKSIMPIKYWRKFLKEAKYNSKRHSVQAILKPFLVSKYLFLTRLPFIIKRPIKAKARLFFNQNMMGEFPDPVFSFIWLHRFNEEDLTFTLAKYLKPGMTFLDVGAHIGYFSILASFLVGPKGRVHSFEVTPRTYEMLKINVSHLSNVKANLKAVWSKTKVITFRDYGPFFAPCNSYTEGRIAPHILKHLKPKLWRAKTVSLDEYCRINKVKPDFIKIDVESAEHQVLKGMKEVISKYKPSISIEIGDKVSSNVKGSKANIKLLENLGYKAFNFSNGKIVKHDLRDNYLNMFGNVLLVHKKHHVI